MKKAIVLIPMVMALTACGTFSSKSDFEKRAEAVTEQRTEQLKREKAETPKWFHKEPTVGKSAIYSVGAATAGSEFYAIDLAKVKAKGSICASIDGGVSKKTSVFLKNLSNGETVDLSDSAIVEKCKVSDMSGVEITKQHTEVLNGKWYAWVEVAFPLGEANYIRSQKQVEAERTLAVTEANRRWKEIDVEDKSKKQ